MPVPKPHKDESQDDFISRCMHEVSQNSDRTNEQNLAICHQAWRDRNKQSMRRIDPEDYDDEDEFMSDCMDEMGDQEACETMWEEASLKRVTHKTHSEEVQGMEFVLSDETPDRLEDVIMSDGWD